MNQPLASGVLWGFSEPGSAMPSGFLLWCRAGCSCCELPRSGAIASAKDAYSFSDTGSDSFLGDCLSNSETNSRPEAGVPTLPWRTISLALRSRP